MLNAWYTSSAWLKLFRPLSALYQKVAETRHQRYVTNPDASWQPSVPLIVVGNITLGGTGKTPMVIWLVNYLLAKGLRVGVVSRGYGAKPPAHPWLVRPDENNPAHAGDEPLLIARHCRVPVVIDPNRTRGARYLCDNLHVEVIVSDDGLQHYAMGRSLELVMIDYDRGLGNRRCLPEGPLREPPSRLDSVDFVICTGAPADTEKSFAMQLQPTELVNLVSGERVRPETWRAQPRVQAVAGIGNPDRFCKTLENLSLIPEIHAFADHANYNAESFAEFDHGEPLIMTEKDAIKCRGFARDNWWYLSVEAQLSKAFIGTLDGKLNRLLPVKLDKQSHLGV